MPILTSGKPLFAVCVIAETKGNKKQDWKANKMSNSRAREHVWETNRLTHRVDSWVRVYLQSVNVITRVLEQAIIWVQHLMWQQIEPFPVQDRSGKVRSDHNHNYNQRTKEIVTLIKQRLLAFTQPQKCSHQLEDIFILFINSEIILLFLLLFLTTISLLGSRRGRWSLSQLYLGKGRVHDDMLAITS